MRSWLYVPADRPKMIINAGIYGADGIVFDLEDSTGAGEKDEARILVSEVFRRYDFSPGAERPSVLCVRINGLDSGLWREDLESLIPAGVRLIRIPKVESPDHVLEVCGILEKLEAAEDLVPGAVKIQAILETPKGVENVFNIADASPRLSGLSFGAEDFCASAGLDRSGPAYILDYPRSRITNGAAAAGVEAWDTVWSNYTDLQGLREDALRARNLGFSGKSVIHPDQIEIVNSIFAPTEVQIEWAKKILSAASDESGVFGVDGMMVDAPVIARARRILGSGEADA